MRKLLLLFLFFLAAMQARSQYFSTGEDPAFLKWRQIVTPDFQLIYPEDFEAKAREMAAFFTRVYDYGSATLHHRPARISVIFHTRTVRSNGLVGWAPRRMELFTPPHQDIYAQEWLEQLVLHEFRHVVQVGKIHSQIPGILRALLGEHAAALVTGLYLPFWFLEGDAVISETALSRSGRGRYPSFLMEHRAQVTEKGVFSFDKAFNGSYRDHVPDHYKLGWYLVGGTRARYGSDLWNHTLNQVAHYPLSLSPVNKMMKLMTGYNQEQLYHQVFDSLSRVWAAEDAPFLLRKPEVITQPSRVFTSYRYNHILPSGEILSLKESYNEIPRFVKIDGDGQEETVTVPGELFDESVGYRDHLIVWSEFVPDLRWRHSGRSFLRLYNMEEKTLRTIIPEYKCFAPSISPDEHNLAVVETDFGNRYYLSVYDATSGALVTRYPSPGNRYLFHPEWKDDRELVVVVLTGEGKRLAVVDPFKGDMEILTFVPPGEIRSLTMEGERLWFIHGQSGKNELWSADLTTGKAVRESEARFGADYPAVRGNDVVVSDYTADGYRLVRPLRDHALPADRVPKEKYPLAELLAAQEPGIVEFTNVDTSGYISKPYRKIRHLFNLHSWAPIFFDASSHEAAPGVSLASQNLLGTAEKTAGYKWNLSERTGNYYLQFEYRGWYPLLTARLSTGRRASEFGEITEYRDIDGTPLSRDTVFRRYTWSESEGELDVRVPLNMTRGSYFRMLQPEILYSYTRYGHHPSTPEKFISGNVQSVAYRLYYHQLMRTSVRQIQSRWGWVFDASYRHSPWGNNDLGTLKAIQGRMYWPGVAPNHGITTWIGVQVREPGEYRYSDAIALPFGWQAVNSRRMVSSTVKYALPLVTPDWNFSKLVYIRRVRGALFYDQAWLKGDMQKEGMVAGSYNRRISSVGIDLLADGNMMRFYAPVSAGIRSAWLPEVKELRWEFLFSVDFTSF